MTEMEMNEYIKDLERKIRYLERTNDRLRANVHSLEDRVEHLEEDRNWWKKRAKKFSKELRED